MLKRIEAGERVIVGLAPRYRAKTGLAYLGGLAVLGSGLAWAQKVPIAVPILVAVGYVLLFVYDYWLGAMCIGLDKEAIIRAEVGRIRMVWSDVREIRVVVADGPPAGSSRVVAIRLTSNATPENTLSLHRYENLEAIANTISSLTKCPITPVLVVPTPAAAKLIPLKPVPSTGDPYVDSCFTIDFQELTDTRQWTDIPGAAAIPPAANGGNQAQAVALAKALQTSHPDFYFSYYWLASLACGKGYCTTPRYDDARSILNEGLRRSNRKTEICSKRADIEWAARDLPEAIIWWIRHAILQVATGAKDHTAFLYLSYVAAAVGLPDQSRRFLQRVDQIVSGGMRLMPDEATGVHAAVSRLPTTASVKQALELLDRAFLLQQ